MTEIQRQLTLLNFVNLHLSQNDRWINHISDLSNGVDLYYFLESVCKTCEKKIDIKTELDEMDDSANQKNIDVCLSWLKKEQIPIQGVEAEHISKKDENLIVELLSKVVSHFHIRGGDIEITKKNEKSPYDEIIEWVCEVVKLPSERPKALEDWKSGEFLFNLIKRVARSLDDPLFDETRMRPTNDEILLNKCIAFAFNSMGIPKVVTSNEFLNPEDFSIAIYLSFFQKYSRKERRGLSFIVGTKEINKETRQSIYESFPYRRRVENSKIKSTEFFGICRVLDASEGLKKYVTRGEGEWGYVLIFYGVNDKRRKLMICPGGNRTFIFKLSDLIKNSVVKKKKQIKLEKSNGEFTVLQFQRQTDYDTISDYCLLSISNREDRLRTKPPPKLKGLGTNRAIQKTYYLKGKMTSTGIYSKTPIAKWTKKQICRWFERIYYEDDEGRVESIESILKRNKILDGLVQASFDEKKKKRDVEVLESMKRVIIENDKDLISSFHSKPDSVEEKIKLEMIKVADRLLTDIEVLEHLEVTDDPEKKFFSKTYRKVFDKLTEQRDSKVRITDMERLLRFEKPWLWDVDEFRDNMMCQMLFSYPLFTTKTSQHKQLMDVFENILFKYLLQKLNKTVPVNNKKKEEEDNEEVEGEEEEEEKQEDKTTTTKNLFELMLEIDPTKFEVMFHSFCDLLGFRLDMTSFKVHNVCYINKHRLKLKEMRSLCETFDHENKILEETKIQELEKKISEDDDDNEKKLELERFKAKIEENKKRIANHENMIIEMEKIIEELKNKFKESKTSEEEYWIFLRSPNRRNEIEKMIRARISHILGELKRQGKERYLVFPVQLFLWRRKLKVSPEWKKEIMKEIDPMLCQDRYRFGYIHSSFHFPSLELVWAANSLVRLKPLDVRGGYHPIVGIEVPCVMFATYEEIKRRFEDLAMMLMKWNTKRIYSTSGMSKKKKEKDLLILF